MPDGVERPSVLVSLARRGVAVAIAVAAAAAVLALLRARIPGVETWRVSRATVRPVAAGRGKILPPARVSVFPGVIGRVARVVAVAGGSVRAGDPVLELDGAVYAAQVDEAHAAVSAAERDGRRAAEAVDAAARKLDRARGLAGKKIASPEYLEASKLDVAAARRQAQAASASLDAARSRLAAARDALARTRVSAPASGTVAGIRVRAGDTVTESTPVAEIADASTPLASIDVPGRPAIVPGASARVTVAGAGATGVVRDVAANKTGGSPYVTVMIALPSAPGGMRSGMAAVARIDGPPRDGVLAIPVAALAVRPGNGGGRNAVWIVAGGKVRRRAVEVGSVGERLAEITSGLQEGETIAAGPASALRRLADGVRVRAETLRGE